MTLVSGVSGDETSHRIEAHAAPLRQEVVRLLRQEILDQVLVPGQRITEASLCERFGVSRTVVRESLRHLESESLITLLPHRGPIVTVLSRHDIESLYEVRRNLEGLAGELFAQRATQTIVEAMLVHIDVMRAQMPDADVADRGRLKDEFYRLLLAGADNPVLTTALHGLHARVAVFRHYAFQDDEKVVNALQEVATIVHAAAEQRDPAAARRACEDHIERAGRLAVEEYGRRVPHMPN
ncbi:GntR family transcriptional regulator [Nocardioides sp. LHG3406-4]|uniref:GntR family transcriptional regulator n=1 Tax=Nocardioides sp. LHG3406-4 TaxID=2804575 RepID=UPI003CE81592